LKNLLRQFILNCKERRVMLEQENAFYDTHQAEFHEKYLDKWLVITGESLWGVYDKFADAARDALEKLETGKFMLHKPSDDGKVIYLGPRVHIKYPEGSKKKVPRKKITYSNSNGLLKVPYPY